uniref:Transmembrane protein n=1 Tax=Strongyloides venezuelensis TaxID=75913 RepID=A0A0K0EXK0_STRVS
MLYAYDHVGIRKYRCYGAAAIGVFLAVVAVVVSHEKEYHENSKKRSDSTFELRDIIGNHHILNIALGNFFVLQCRSFT